MYEKKTENMTLSSCQSKPQLHVTVNPRKLPQLVGSLTAEPHDQFDRLLQMRCEKRKNSMVLLSHEQVLIPGTTICQYSINELLLNLETCQIKDHLYCVPFFSVQKGTAAGILGKQYLTSPHFSLQTNYYTTVTDLYVHYGRT